MGGIKPFHVAGLKGVREGGEPLVPREGIGVSEKNGASGDVFIDVKLDVGNLVALVEKTVNEAFCRIRGPETVADLRRHHFGIPLPEKGSRAEGTGVVNGKVIELSGLNEGGISREQIRRRRIPSEEKKKNEQRHHRNDKKPNFSAFGHNDDIERGRRNWEMNFAGPDANTPAGGNGNEIDARPMS